MPRPGDGAATGLTEPWRVGRKVGNTVYVVGAARPFALMPTPELAAHIVQLHNAALAPEARTVPHRVVRITDDLVMVDGRDECAHCGQPMVQKPNPHGGDTWFYQCCNGHEAWVGK